jgi:hypothetical protein
MEQIKNAESGFWLEVGEQQITSKEGGGNDKG